MVWLRAHARWLRWGEEIIIVGEEIRRTKATFYWEATRWRKRTADPLGPGYRAYAARQVALWDALHSHGICQFDEVIGRVVAPMVVLP